MTIVDSYASARTSSNLKSRPDGQVSDLDVLGAAGWAGKETFAGRPGTPLGMALLRLFVGDDKEAAAIAVLLSGLVCNKADKLHIKIRKQEADDIAKSVLGWHRNGVCQPCHGIGYEVIGESTGRRVVTERHCKACRGTGKQLFERGFSARHLPLANWLLAEIQREQSKAGPAAMAALAPSLDL